MLQMKRKGVNMRSKLIPKWLCLFLFVLFFLPISKVDARKKVDLVGQETLNFTLPSTRDRIINYADGYYGKHHLIITFFPAAFTPL